MNPHKFNSYVALISAICAGLALLFTGLSWSVKPSAITEAGHKNIFSVEYVQTSPYVENIFVLTDTETQQQYIVIQNEKIMSITPRLSKGVE